MIKKRFIVGLSYFVAIYFFLNLCIENQYSLIKDLKSLILFTILFIATVIIFYVIPQRFLFIKIDNPPNEKLANFLIFMAIVIILASLLFYDALKIKSIYEESAIDFFKLKREIFGPSIQQSFEMLIVQNMQYIFILLSIITLLYSALEIIYAKGKQWLFLFPAVVFAILIVTKFDYANQINLWPWCHFFCNSWKKVKIN